MHVSCSHARQALLRTPSILKQARCRTLSRNTVTEARRGAKALMDLQDEIAEDAAAAEMVWDSPLTLKSILKYPNPQLRVPNGKVKDFGEPLKKLTDEMFEIMYQCVPEPHSHMRDDGVGLAAPQVGVNLKLMVFNPSGERGGQEFVVANPTIISTSKGKDLHEEGCLSFKNSNGVHVLGDVERPTSIKIKAQDVDGKRFKLALKGWSARVFQHEYDHLEGVLFPDRMIVSHLEREKDKLLALEETYRKSNPNSTIVSIVSTRLAWNDAEDWKER